MSSPNFTIENNKFSELQGLNLVVRGDWSEEAALVLQTGRADGLVLNYALGFRERSLDFLKDLPIARIIILARTLRDLDSLYDLAPTLNEIRLDVHNLARLDLSRFPYLRVAAVDWNTISDSAAGYCGNLSSLLVAGLGTVDLTQVAKVGPLVSLRVQTARKLGSLDGIASLSGLQLLDVYGAPLLGDYSALQNPAAQTGFRY